MLQERKSFIFLCNISNVKLPAINPKLTYKNHRFVAKALMQSPVQRMRDPIMATGFPPNLSTQILTNGPVLEKKCIMIALPFY